jgi:hypothetical protein
MVLKYFSLIFFLVTLFSCGNKTSETQIIGKWQYEKTGYKYGKETRWEFQKVSQNYKVIFSMDGSLTVENGEAEKHKGVYKLIQNGKSIVTELYIPYEKDTVNILKLTSDILQIQTNDVSMQLKRVK